MTISLMAQDHKTYENFYENRWELPYNWANKDTITLKLAKNDDLKEFEFGEFISFSENKK